MKFIDTSSSQCKILKYENKKYIIRYPNNIGVVSEYYRFTPETAIIDLLEKNNIKVPKNIKITPYYLVQEYIEGNLLSDIYQDYNKIDRKIINQIINQICLLTEVDYTSLLKYTSWTNNRSFYTFQCQNTMSVFQNYYQRLKDLYDKLGISSNILNILMSYSNQIDNNRNLSIIHGDRHKKNIILQNNEKVVFIDWKLGGIGDLAYDIAFHLHQMAYAKEDEKFLLNKLEETYTGNFKMLLKDIKLYKLFILARSCIYHVYWTYLVYKEENEWDKKKQLVHFMRRYNRLSEFTEFALSYKNEEELDNIFRDFYEMSIENKFYSNGLET